MGTVKDADRKILVELTSLLKKNAEKVLQGDTKVCLTSSSLEILVSSFRRYSENGEDGESSSHEAGNRKNKLAVAKQLAEQKRWKESVRTLLDFVHKIKALKIINSSYTLKAPIQIARFASLQVLEVKKVPIHMLEGLSKLRGQLKEIIISKSLQELQGLLEICGGDRASGLVWSSLTVAHLSFNGLHKLDDSLRLVPFLEVLDLSHNELKDTEDHLLNLPDVRQLNLGFNLLSCVPKLSMSNKVKLRTLVLRNNNLDNLEGLEEMSLLEELDVSMNCFVEHDVLHVLPGLIRLRVLYLNGNPLCYKPDHRHLALKQLSPHVALTGFTLDRHPLSPNEVQIVRQNQYQKRKSLVVNGDNDEPDCEEEVLVIHHTGSRLDPKSPHEKNKKRGHRRLHSKERVPAIGNFQDSLTEEYASTDVTPATSYKEESNVKTDIEKDKQRYEILREHYKDDWLKALSAEQNRNPDKPGPANDTAIKGDKPGPANGSVEKRDKQGVTREDAIDAHDKKIKETFENSEKRNIEKDTKNKVKTEDSAVTRQDPTVTHQSTGSPTVTNQHTEKPPMTSVTSPTPPTTPTSPEYLHISDTTDIYSARLVNEKPRSMAEPQLLIKNKLEEMEPTTDNEDLYGDESEPLIVMKPDEEMRQMFVTVNNRYIIEKDITGKKIGSLDLKCLMNMQTTEQSVGGKDIVGEVDLTVVTMNFDYVKKDMRQRKYAMEDSNDALILQSLLDPFLKSKEEQANMQDQLECLKCKHQFTLPQSMQSTVSSCPKCRSKMVIKLEPTIQQEILKSSSTTQLLESPQTQQDDKLKRSPSMKRKSASPQRPTNIVKPVDIEATPRLKSGTFEGSLSDYVDKLIPEEDPDLKVTGDRRKGVYQQNNDAMPTSNTELSTEPTIRANNSWSDEGRMASSQSLTRSSISSVESDITVLTMNSRGSFSVISESSHEVVTRDRSSGLVMTENTRDNQAVFRIPDSQERGDSVRSGGDDSDANGVQWMKASQGQITPVGSPLTNSVCSSMVSSVYENTLSGGGEDTGAGREEGASSLTGSSADSVSLRYSTGEGRRIRSQHRSAMVYSQSGNSSDELMGEASSVYDTATSRQEDTELSLESSCVSANRTFSSIYDKVTSGSGSEKEEISDSSPNVTRRSRDNLSVHTESSSHSSPLKRSGNRSRSRSANRRGVFGESLLEESVESANSSDLPDFPSDLSPIKIVSSQNKKTVNQSETDLKTDQSDEPDAAANGSYNTGTGSSLLPWELEEKKEKSAKHESLIHDEFINIDHRIQLYLELKVLKSEEQIQCAIQSTIVQYMMPEPVKSLLVISSHRILIFRIEGELDSNTSSDWLKCYEDQPITELQYIDIGLGYQSLRLEFSTECSSYTLLICDEARCKQFLTLLSDIVQTTAIHEHSKLESISKSNPTTLDNLQSEVLVYDEAWEEEEEGEQRLVRYLLIHFMDPDKEEDEGRILGLVVTPSDLILVEENHQWPLPRLQAPLSNDIKGQQFTVLQREKINNIETFVFNEFNPAELKLTFFENSADSAVAVWYVSMETTKGVKSLVDAIREPWEEEFGVALDVTSQSFNED